MVRGSGVGAVIRLTHVPVLKGAWSLVGEGIAPGGSRRNLEFLRDRIVAAPGVSEDDLLVLADAQTSGGLLIAVPAADAERLKEELVRRKVPVFAEIGEIVNDPDSRISIEP
jgi:selenide,water dikinase